MKEMKKEIFDFSEAMRRMKDGKKVRESWITPNDEWFYKGHHYLEWNGSQYRDCIVHDPDCPCYLDTLGIYVVDNKDTTYVIRKK